MMKATWDVLYKYGVDVVVNGHDHLYERFLPQDPTAIRGPAGITEYIVGTGGAPLYDFGPTAPNSAIKFKNLRRGLFHAAGRRLGFGICRGWFRGAPRFLHVALPLTARSSPPAEPLCGASLAVKCGGDVYPFRFIRDLPDAAGGASASAQDSRTAGESLRPRRRVQGQDLRSRLAGRLRARAARSGSAVAIRHAEERLGLSLGAELVRGQARTPRWRHRRSNWASCTSVRSWPATATPT